MSRHSGHPRYNPIARNPTTRVSQVIDESEEDIPLTRADFLNLAGICEGSLFAIAFIAGWFLDVRPVGQMYWDWWSFVVGLIATLPMLLLFGALYWIDIAPLRRIRKMLAEMISPLLSRCRWFDLLLLASIAGVCEEVLFRGFLQSWLGRWDLTMAIVVTSIVFGLMHCVTPTYAIVATLIGGYMSGIMFLVDEPNLLVPITAHAVYDFIGFLILAAEHRRTQRQSPLPLVGPSENE